MMPKRGLALVALHPLRRLLLLLLGLASAFVRPVPWATRRVPPPTGRAWMLRPLLLLLLQMLLQRPLLLPLIPGMRVCRGAVWPVCHRAFRYTMCAHHTCIPSAWLCQNFML